MSVIAWRSSRSGAPDAHRCLSLSYKVTSTGRLAVGVVAATLAARGVADPDLWGHLRFGLDALTAARLTSLDQYSFTQDRPWINHEWLSEVLFALAYRTGGLAGLVTLKTLLVAGTTAFVSRAMRHTTPSAAWWLAAALMALTPSAQSFRPHLWTLAGVAAIVSMLARGALSWWTPLLFALWANLHGGWIVGFGIIGAWGLGRLVDERRVVSIQRDAMIAIGAFFATLVTPYGWRLWMFLLSTVPAGRDITEWQPLWRQADLSHLALWLLTCVSLAVAFAQRWHGGTWSARLPALLLAILAWRVDRLAPIFGLASVLVLAEAWRRDPSAPPAPRPGRQRLIDVVVVVGVWMVSAVPLTRCLPLAGEWIPDLEAAGALAAATPSGRLVLPFDWGEYAIWHLGPRLRVSIDGRNETIYSPQVVSTQTSVLNGGSEGLSFLERERPEYVWLPRRRGTATGDWLASHGYRLDVETARSSVAVRDDLPVLSPAPALRSCFP